MRTAGSLVVAAVGVMACLALPISASVAIVLPTHYGLTATRLDAAVNQMYAHGITEVNTPPRRECAAVEKKNTDAAPKTSSSKSGYYYKYFMSSSHLHGAGLAAVLSSDFLMYLLCGGIQCTFAID